MGFGGINQYKQNSIATAAPEELTLLLYNGAIKFMNIGKMKIEEKDIQGKNEALIRAQDIISELNYSLNMDYEISEGLRALYSFVLEKLIDANIENSIEDIDDAITVTKEMRETWVEVMKQVKNKSISANG